MKIHHRRMHQAHSRRHHKSDDYACCYPDPQNDIQQHEYSLSAYRQRLVATSQVDHTTSNSIQPAAIITTSNTATNCNAGHAAPGPPSATPVADEDATNNGNTTGTAIAENKAPRARAGAAIAPRTVAEIARPMSPNNKMSSRTSGCVTFAFSINTKIGTAANCVTHSNARLKPALPQSTADR